MKRLIDTFLDLVRIDSPTGEEQLVREYIQNFLQEYRIFSHVDPAGNMLATIPGTGEPLLLSAHMDTVQPGRGVKPRKENGYIVSDGTTILGVDNKIGIAIMLTLVENLNKINHRPLELLFTVAEEAGTSGASQFDYTQVESELGYCFDLTEELGGIVIGSPFYESFEVIFHGTSAHASRPHLGNNILPSLATFLSQTSYGKLSDDLYFNVGQITAGDATNTVPGTAKLVGEIRSFTQDTLSNKIEQVKAILEEVATHYHITIDQTWTLENPGYLHTSDEAKQFIQETEHRLETVGITPQRKKVVGISDANELNAHGIVTLELSTGGENAHTTSERISIANMEKLYEILGELVKEK